MGRLRKSGPLFGSANVSAITARLDALDGAADRVMTRAPTTSDIAPAGVVWKDTTWGTTAPAQWVSEGGGIWRVVRRVKVQAVRITLAGRSSSFTQCTNLNVLDAAGTPYAAGAWKVGASGGFWGSIPAAGTVVGAQSFNPATNNSAWVDLEPVDPLRAGGFGGVSGNLRSDFSSTGIMSAVVTFDNGFTRTFTWNQYGQGATACAAVPAIPAPSGGDVYQSATPPDWKPGIQVLPGQRKSDPISHAVFESKLSRVTGLTYDDAEMSPANWEMVGRGTIVDATPGIIFRGGGKNVWAVRLAGTSPDAAGDQVLAHALPGVAMFNLEGFMETNSVPARRVTVSDAGSGNATTGPLVAWHASDNKLHWVNSTGSTVWQKCPYVIYYYYYGS